MAFERKFLARVGGSGEAGSVWKYSSFEAMADVLAVGFFNPAFDEFLVGDILLLIDKNSPGTDSIFQLSFVVSKTAGTKVVGIASGTAVGNT
tara:strand:+ start:216 stop:491 length:276 start_codon:yes stop_codon:yes gene_type:complete